MKRMTFRQWEDTFGPYEEHDSLPKDAELNKTWSFVQLDWEEEYETDKFILPGVPTTVEVLKFYTTKHAYTFIDQEVAVTYN